MALTKYKLGDLIYELQRFNTDSKYGIEYVRGISNTKKIMPTKADVDTNILHKFYIINPGEFIYNPRTTRMGEKVGLAYNNTNTPLLFTFNNIGFAIKETAKNILSGDYLYMYFNREAFDRYAITNSWGSATELFTFEEMCDIDIELPDLPTQQKYVDIYKAMVANQQSYERGLDDLKLVCDGYIEDLRRKMPCEKIGPYIDKVDEKNVDELLGINDVKSINKDGTFAETVANVDETRISTYKVVHPNDFAYTNRINIGSIARRLPEDGSCLVSASYDVFRVTNTEKLSPEYLTLWIRRSEFFRSTGFYAVGSVKDSFSIDMMKLLEIPIPCMAIQKAIVDIYQSYLKRKEINERLKAQIKNICPILIKGSLEDKN